jgi:hypothetical protein
VLPATSDSYEIAELKIQSLGLSVGARGALAHGIPYAGRKFQHTGFNSSKDEIKLFLSAIGYPTHNYDFNSAIVHYPLNEDYFDTPSYHELMRRLKSKFDFRIWREDIFT